MCLFACSYLSLCSCLYVEIIILICAHYKRTGERLQLLPSTGELLSHNNHVPLSRFDCLAALVVLMLVMVQTVVANYFDFFLLFVPCMYVVVVTHSCIHCIHICMCRLHILACVHIFTCMRVLTYKLCVALKQQR